MSLSITYLLTISNFLDQDQKQRSKSREEIFATYNFIGL